MKTKSKQPMNLVDRILLRLARLWAAEQGDKDTLNYLQALPLAPLSPGQRTLLAEYTCQHGELEAARLAQQVHSIEAARRMAAPLPA